MLAYLSMLWNDFLKERIFNFSKFSEILHNSFTFECTRALSEITEKCPLLSNQWSFFNSVNDMIFLISLRMFPEIMKCIILHNECLDDFKDGGPP